MPGPLNRPKSPFQALPPPSLTLGEVGEDGLIDLLARVFLVMPGPGVEVGIGDDAAILEATTPGSRLVVTADAFVEGTHFVLPHHVTPAIAQWGDRLAEQLVLGMDQSHQLMTRVLGMDPTEEIPSRPRPQPAIWADAWMMALGHRLAMANLSDLAAMGAKPAGLTLTIAAPGHVSARALGFLVQGLHEAGIAAGAALVGGDTVKTTGPLCLSVQALGYLAEGAPACLRTSAEPGDQLWVSGPVGCGQLAPELLLGAYPNVDTLMKTDPGRRDVIEVLVRNMTSPARVGVVTLMGQHSRRNIAVTDVSDGLTREARRMAWASGVDLHLDADCVPVDPAAARIMETLSETERLARILGSGEEWQLLVARPPDPDPPQPAPGISWTLIGHVTKPEDPASPKATLWHQGQPFTSPDRTYKHFPSSETSGE